MASAKAVVAREAALFSFKDDAEAEMGSISDTRPPAKSTSVYVPAPEPKTISHGRVTRRAVYDGKDADGKPRKRPVIKTKEINLVQEQKEAGHSPGVQPAKWDCSVFHASNIVMLSDDLEVRAEAPEVVKIQKDTARIEDVEPLNEMVDEREEGEPLFFEEEGSTVIKQKLDNSKPRPLDEPPASAREPVTARSSAPDVSGKFKRGANTVKDAIKFGKNARRTPSMSRDRSLNGSVKDEESDTDSVSVADMQDPNGPLTLTGEEMKEAKRQLAMKQARARAKNSGLKGPAATAAAQRELLELTEERDDFLVSSSESDESDTDRGIHRNHSDSQSHSTHSHAKSFRARAANLREEDERPQSVTGKAWVLVGSATNLPLTQKQEDSEVFCVLSVGRHKRTTKKAKLELGKTYIDASGATKVSYTHAWNEKVGPFEIQNAAKDKVSLEVIVSKVKGGSVQSSESVGAINIRLGKKVPISPKRVDGREYCAYSAEMLAPLETESAPDRDSSKAKPTKPRMLTVTVFYEPDTPDLLTTESLKRPGLAKLDTTGGFGAFKGIPPRLGQFEDRGEKKKKKKKREYESDEEDVLDGAGVAAAIGIREESDASDAEVMENRHNEQSHALETTVVDDQEVYVPMVVISGTLFVHLLHGRGLMQADIFGKSDPYCVVTLTNDNYRRQRLQTDVIFNTLDPKWNEQLPPLTVADLERQALRVEIYDKDVASDDFLGFFEIPLHNTDLQLVNGQSKNLTCTVQQGKGDVTLSLRFVSDAKVEEKSKAPVVKPPPPPSVLTSLLAGPKAAKAEAKPEHPEDEHEHADDEAEEAAPSIKEMGLLRERTMSAMNLLREHSSGSTITDVGRQQKLLQVTAMDTVGAAKDILTDKAPEPLPAASASLEETIEDYSGTLSIALQSDLKLPKSLGLDDPSGLVCRATIENNVKKRTFLSSKSEMSMGSMRVASFLQARLTIEFVMPDEGEEVLANLSIHIGNPKLNLIGGSRKKATVVVKDALDPKNKGSVSLLLQFTADPKDGIDPALIARQREEEEYEALMAREAEEAERIAAEAKKDLPVSTLSLGDGEKLTEEKAVAIAKQNTLAKLALGAFGFGRKKSQESLTSEATSETSFQSESQSLSLDKVAEASAELEKQVKQASASAPAPKVELAPVLRASSIEEKKPKGSEVVNNLVAEALQAARSTSGSSDASKASTSAGSSDSGKGASHGSLAKLKVERKEKKAKKDVLPGTLEVTLVKAINLPPGLSSCEVALCVTSSSKSKKKKDSVETMKKYSPQAKSSSPVWMYDFGAFAVMDFNKQVLHIELFESAAPAAGKAQRKLIASQDLKLKNKSLSLRDGKHKDISFSLVPTGKVNLLLSFTVDAEYLNNKSVMDSHDENLYVKASAPTLADIREEPSQMSTSQLSLDSDDTSRPRTATEGDKQELIEKMLRDKQRAAEREAAEKERLKQEKKDKKKAAKDALKEAERMEKQRKEEEKKAKKEAEQRAKEEAKARKEQEKREKKEKEEEARRAKEAAKRSKTLGSSSSSETVPAVGLNSLGTASSMASKELLNSSTQDDYQDSDEPLRRNTFSGVSMVSAPSAISMSASRGSMSGLAPLTKLPEDGIQEEEEEDKQAEPTRQQTRRSSGDTRALAAVAAVLTPSPSADAVQKPIAETTSTDALIPPKKTETKSGGFLGLFGIKDKEQERLEREREEKEIADREAAEATAAEEARQTKQKQEEEARAEKERARKEEEDRKRKEEERARQEAEERQRREEEEAEKARQAEEEKKKKKKGFWPFGGSKEAAPAPEPVKVEPPKPAALLKSAEELDQEKPRPSVPGKLTVTFKKAGPVFDLEGRPFHTSSQPHVIARASIVGGTRPFWPMTNVVSLTEETPQPEFNQALSSLTFTDIAAQPLRLELVQLDLDTRGETVLGYTDVRMGGRLFDTIAYGNPADREAFLLHPRALKKEWAQLTVEDRLSTKISYSLSFNPSEPVPPVGSFAPAAELTPSPSGQPLIELQSAGPSTTSIPDAFESKKPFEEPKQKKKSLFSGLFKKKEEVSTTPFFVVSEMPGGAVDTDESTDKMGIPLSTFSSQFIEEKLVEAKPEKAKERDKPKKEEKAQPVLDNLSDHGQSEHGTEPDDVNIGGAPDGDDEAHANEGFLEITLQSAKDLPEKDKHCNPYVVFSIENSPFKGEKLTSSTKTKTNSPDWGLEKLGRLRVSDYKDQLLVIQVFNKGSMFKKDGLLAQSDMQIDHLDHGMEEENGVELLDDNDKVIGEVVFTVFFQRKPLHGGKAANAPKGKVQRASSSSALSARSGSSDFEDQDGVDEDELEEEEAERGGKKRK